ncbi:MAG: hypothetical protein HQK51_13015, partial [Oligoflexia bacterium]|nr:hypothetical protein [Oligoflexia bacterium]
MSNNKTNNKKSNHTDKIKFIVEQIKEKENARKQYGVSGVAFSKNSVPHIVPNPK